MRQENAAINRYIIKVYKTPIRARISKDSHYGRLIQDWESETANLPFTQFRYIYTYAERYKTVGRHMKNIKHWLDKYVSVPYSFDGMIRTRTLFMVISGMCNLHIPYWKKILDILSVS